MLFHVEWEVLPHNRNQAQERFKETGAVPPEGVVMQGWTDLLSFNITPVVSDQELVEIFG